MKDHINQVLNQIETDYDVKIIYACESGSRAWGFPSENSDFDVRFIYVHKINWYLSIDKGRDVIDVSIQNKLDVSGWELTKALRLLRKSNPSILEWINSSIVYHNDFSIIDQMRKLSEEYFNPKPCLFHYIKMAKGNFREILKGKEPQIKTYLNVLRPIITAKWIEKNQTFPPNHFQTVVEEVIANGEEKAMIRSILEAKRTGNIIFLEKQLGLLHQYFQTEIQQLEDHAKSLHNNIIDSTNQLNTLFRDSLEEVWKNEE